MAVLYLFVTFCVTVCLSYRSIQKTRWWKSYRIWTESIRTTNNDYGSFSMISEDLGYGIYPRIMAEKSRFPVVGIPIEKGNATPFSLGIRSYEKLFLATKAFVDHITDVLKET